MQHTHRKWCLVGSLVVAAALVAKACSNGRLDAAPPVDADGQIRQHALRMLDEGRETFRHDTFGSERFFGQQLRLHESVAGAANGGIGPGLSPRLALTLGLKVDLDALPDPLVQSLRDNEINLDDPAITLALLRIDAVVGVTGVFTEQRLTSIGIQCALCHSTVDDSLQAGIGRRLDGWANRDLDVGRIIALAPTVQPIAALLQVDEFTVRQVLTAWGPGRFDAQLLLDGKGFRPDRKTAATLIPPAFGLAGVNQHTSTGAWGSVTYWNAFVANIEMQGQGRFFDPRLNDAEKYPVAARAKLHDIRAETDRISPKLAALHFYQLAIPAPSPASDSFQAEPARRGKELFAGQAGCARCHVPPTFTEPGWNLHPAEEIGIDDFQAKRSPDGRYRTAPLRGLFSHAKGGFYHDGRFATLQAVVDHYDSFFGLGLNPQQKNDLIEYLKSL
jgi:hypothetical protein